MKNKDIALTDAQRSMVEANMDVVRWAIRTSIQVNEQHYGFGYDDLFQEGCIWLCKAAVTYDPDGGASFSTYAQRVVENGLRTYAGCSTARSGAAFLYRRSLTRRLTVTVPWPPASAVFRSSWLR